MAFLHTCDCSNVPGASGPGVPLCTIVPRDVHFKKKKKKKDSRLGPGAGSGAVLVLEMHMSVIMAGVRSKAHASP